MLRRLLRIGPIAHAFRGKAPGDSDSMNKFADEYNSYVEKLKAGILDPKHWARVEKAWDAMR